MADGLALAALGAILLDVALGWPKALYRHIGHPVGLFARFLLALAGRWNHAPHQRGKGALALLLLVGWVAGSTFLLQEMLQHFTGILAPLLLALCAWPALALRSLETHVRAVLKPLESGDLPAARQAVGQIVGRDVTSLDRHGVARAAIESLAESFADGVVAPLFWFCLLGLPGIWGVKAINTADSLVGYRTPRWRRFGAASARADDLMNFVPARLSGLLFCLAGGGWRVLFRDARKPASPNAGWPESAMAGALGLRLGGPACYDGILQEKPWLGEGRGTATVADLRRALALYRRASLLLLFVVGGLIWLP